MIETINSGYVIFIINLILAGIVGFIAAWLKISISFHRLSTLETRVANNTSRLDSLSEKASELKGALEIYKAWVQSKSPLSLTEEGEKALIESHGKEYVESHQKLLLDEIKSK